MQILILLPVFLCLLVVECYEETRRRRSRRRRTARATTASLSGAQAKEFTTAMTQRSLRLGLPTTAVGPVGQIFGCAVYVDASMPKDEIHVLAVLANGLTSQTTVSLRSAASTDVAK